MAQVCSNCGFKRCVCKAPKKVQVCSVCNLSPCICFCSNCGFKECVCYKRFELILNAAKEQERQRKLERQKQLEEKKKQDSKLQALKLSEKLQREVLLSRIRRKLEKGTLSIEEAQKLFEEGREAELTKPVEVEKKLIRKVRI